MWEDMSINRQRALIYNHAMKRESVRMRGLALALKVRWVESPEWADKEIPQLLAKRCQERLFDFISEQSMPEEFAKDLEKQSRVHWIESACEAISQALKFRDVADTFAKAMQRYIESMKKLLAMSRTKSQISIGEQNAAPENPAI